MFLPAQLRNGHKCNDFTFLRSTHFHVMHKLETHAGSDMETKNYSKLKFLHFHWKIGVTYPTRDILPLYVKLQQVFAVFLQKTGRDGDRKTLQERIAFVRQVSFGVKRQAIWLSAGIVQYYFTP